jgi:hypothetical protein
MKLIQLLENRLIDIQSEDIKIENGIMIPNQFPNEVNRFDCSHTDITSLEFGPKIVGHIFDCSNTKITSLDYAPIIVKERFDCYGNNILHLKGIGQSYLKDCKELLLPETVKSNILGLCRVKNLENIYIFSKQDLITSGDLYEAIQIVKKYLNTDGSECTEELIQNGFNDYAKF